MTNTNPREFWIASKPKYDSLFGPIYNATESKANELQIHVVEISAYQAALEEIEALKAKVAELEKKINEYEQI